MFSLPHRYRVEAVFLLLCVVVSLIAVAWRVEVLTQRTTTLLEERIMHARGTLIELAALSRNNQLLPNLESVAHRCAEQSVFDEGLATLNQKSKEELAEMRVLLASCGNDAARTRALMAMRMHETIAHTHALLSLRELYRNDVVLAEWVHAWEAIATVEEERAQHMFTQVALQARIIDALREEKDTTVFVREAEDTARALAMKGEESLRAAAHEEELWVSEVAPLLSP